jgi:arabinose-5-phosphate isomerase
VVEAGGRLAGIITDGDLRRLMQQRRGETLELTAGEAMTKNPVSIEPDALAGSALNLMEQRKITSIVVVNSESQVVGVVHLHDLWTLQLF